jgi:hypothetical protein
MDGTLAHWQIEEEQIRTNQRLVRAEPGPRCYDSPWVALANRTSGSNPNNAIFIRLVRLHGTRIQEANFDEEVPAPTTTLVEPLQEYV